MHIPYFLSGVASAAIVSSVAFTSISIASGQTSTPVASTTTPASTTPVSALIEQGRSLFLGNARFNAGGPPCNACHNVSINAISAGGTLAKDLTKVFSRLGAEGVNAMLPRKDEPSPFPVMQAAFQGRELSTAESAALVAFLQDVNTQAATQPANDFGTKMLLAGGSGIVLLLLLFALVGRGRKRHSVNQELFERQLKTD